MTNIKEEFELPKREHCSECIYYRYPDDTCDHYHWDYAYPIVNWIIEQCDGEGMLQKRDEESK